MQSDFSFCDLYKHKKQSDKICAKSAAELAIENKLIVFLYLYFQVRHEQIPEILILFTESLRFN